MLPAVSVAKDDIVDTESFQSPQPAPSTAPVVFASRQAPSPLTATDTPWVPPVITRTAATPIATPQGSLHGSLNDVAMSKNLRNTLTVDRVSMSSSPASPGIVRARVSTHLMLLNL